MDLKNRLEGADWTNLARGRNKRVGVETSRMASRRESDSGKVGDERNRKADLETKLIVLTNGTGQYFQKC